jgi:hypothetical protein
LTEINPVHTRGRRALVGLVEAHFSGIVGVCRDSSGGETMAKDPSHQLKDVAAAVGRQKLVADDLRLLRAKIAELQDLRTESLMVRQALRNLRVASTQLRTIEQRSAGAAFDERAFEALPAHLRKRILARLDNIARRMAGATDKAGAGEYEDPAFTCVRDYERCRRDAKVSAFWCQMTMVVCLIRSVLPALAAARK